MMNNTAFYSEPMVLRFDSYEKRIAKGKVQAVSYRIPFQFESMDQLFMIMDDVLDSIHFPRREGALRHLIRNTTEQPCQFRDIDYGDYIENIENIENEWKTAGGSGFHGQMTVMVNRREHSSMQGVLVMNGEKVNFRSALELMHMFHEYLEKIFDES